MHNSQLSEYKTQIHQMQGRHLEAAKLWPCLEHILLKEPNSSIATGAFNLKQGKVAVWDLPLVAGTPCFMNSSSLHA